MLNIATRPTARLNSPRRTDRRSTRLAAPIRRTGVCLPLPARRMGDAGRIAHPMDETAITYLFDEEQMIGAGSPESGVAAFGSRQIGIEAATVTVEANGLVIGDDGRTWRRRSGPASETTACSGGRAPAR